MHAGMIPGPAQTGVRGWGGGVRWEGGGGCSDGVGSIKSEMRPQEEKKKRWNINTGPQDSGKTH